jgi:transcriptional regulator with XRE-family HTH domain
MTSQAAGSIATRIGANIRVARDASDLTQRQLAEAIDVDAMLVSKWERGRHRPSDQNLQLVAEVTGRELAWFYTDHTTEQRAA